MKSTIFSMLIVLCVLAVIPMFLMGDKDLMAKLSNFGFGDGSNDAVDLRAKAPKNLTNVTTDSNVTVYKWRDANGVMQFTSTPPPGQAGVDRVELQPNTNIVKAVEVPAEEEPEKSTAAPKVMMTGSSPYTPSGMKELIGNTSDLQEMMSQKQVEQDKMMEDLFGKKK